MSKRMLCLRALFLITVLVLDGCESDKATAPVNQELTLFLPQEAVVGAVGYAVSIPVTAQVTTDQSTPVSGVQVSFRLLSGAGTFVAGSYLTDSFGKVSGNLVTNLQHGDSKLILVATTTEVSTRGEVTTKGTGLPSEISILNPPSNIYTPVDTPVLINLHAGIIDSKGYGISDVPLQYEIRSTNGGVTYGRLSGDATSRVDGSIQFAFASAGGYGMQYIIVATDTTDWKGAFVSDTAQIAVLRSSSQINSLSIWATPSVIDPDDTVQTATVHVQVLDVNKVGVPYVNVNLSTSMGVLWNVTPTDESGAINALFNRNSETGTAEITASISGTGLIATCYIRVQGQPLDSRHLALFADRDYIYADNGLTVANLSAVLKNDDNQAIVGVPVTFHCSLGAVTGMANTDTLGIARAVFIGQGVPSLDQHGNVVPVKIYARYTTANLVDSVAISIRPRSPITVITLQSAKMQMMVASEDSATLRATCFLRGGSFAPTGTQVHFTVENENGRCSPAVATVGLYGYAYASYFAGNIAGTAVLRAAVFNEYTGNDSVTYSNDVHISLLPEPSWRMTIRYDLLHSNVIVRITDQFDNPCRQGELVTFSTTNGDVTPSALTNENGEATVRITGGNNPQPIVVTAHFGDVEASITIPPTNRVPSSFNIRIEEGVLQPSGSGGDSTRNITVEVRDQFGELFQPPVTVLLQILGDLEPPAGAHFGSGSVTDSIVTQNGIGTIELRAGTMIGGLLIRVVTWRDWDQNHAGADGVPRTDPFSVTISTIVVVAGPPRHIDFDLDDVEDTGAGMWRIPVLVRLSDSHHNPISEPAQITATLNPALGEIRAGAAWDRFFIYFADSLSGQETNLRMSVESILGTFSSERTVTLALQNGTLSLTVDPQSWRFDREHPNDTCTFKVTARLVNGHGVPINNMPILFRCDRERFYWRNERTGRFNQFPAGPIRKYTGVVNAENNEPPGTATVYLRGVMGDVYFDDFTLEVTVHVEASVEGHDIAADPAFIFMTR